MKRKKIQRRDVKYTRKDKGDGNRHFVALNETNFYFKIQISIHLSWTREGKGKVAVGFEGFEDLSRVYQAIIDTGKANFVDKSFQMKRFKIDEKLRKENFVKN